MEDLTTLFSWPAFNIFSFYFYFIIHYLFFPITFFKSQSRGYLLIFF